MCKRWVTIYQLTLRHTAEGLSVHTCGLRNVSRSVTINGCRSGKINGCRSVTINGCKSVTINV